MKGFYRVVCGAAAVLLSLGLLLGVVGFVMGGRISDLDEIYLPFRVVYPLHGVWRIGPLNWGTRGNPLYGHDTIDTVYPSTDIRDLDFDFSFADVTIKEGDSFRIVAKKINAKRLRTELVGDTWEIECDVRKADKISGNNTPTITITVPRGFVADELELKLAAGPLEMKNLSARESAIDIGMGSLTGSGFSSGDCKLTVGMGSVELTGEITGRGSIECGMGAVDLTLTGSPEDYGFDVEVGMGSVDVNGQEFSPDGLPPIGGYGVGGLVAQRSWNTSAPNFFEIDCGMGSVAVNFRKP